MHIYELLKSFHYAVHNWIALLKSYLGHDMCVYQNAECSIVQKSNQMEGFYEHGLIYNSDKTFVFACFVLLKRLSHCGYASM